jgi:hypothetical protein
LLEFDLATPKTVLKVLLSELKPSVDYLIRRFAFNKESNDAPLVGSSVERCKFEYDLIFLCCKSLFVEGARSFRVILMKNYFLSVKWLGLEVFKPLS